MTPETTQQELIEKARVRTAKAIQLVHELCAGARRWVLSVPARPDYDPDFILSDALQSTTELADALEEANGERQTVERRLYTTQHNWDLAKQERDQALTEVRKLTEDNLKLREALGRYRWRPISELHEDFGNCVLMNIDDPGGMELGSNLNLDYDESRWTHFALVPLLGQNEYEALRAEPAGEGTKK